MAVTGGLLGSTGDEIRPTALGCDPEGREKTRDRSEYGGWRQDPPPLRAGGAPLQHHPPWSPTIAGRHPPAPRRPGGPQTAVADTRKVAALSELRRGAGTPKSRDAWTLGASQEPATKLVNGHFTPNPQHPTPQPAQPPKQRKNHCKVERADHSKGRLSGSARWSTTRSSTTDESEGEATVLR